MLQRMEADILFCNPDDVDPAAAVLIEHGFDVETLYDRIDDCGPTVFIRVCIVTEIGEDHFFDWVQSIIEPLGGNMIEAGLADPPAPATVAPSAR